MTFHSILFENSADGSQTETPEAPAFFVDLNLDQMVDAITGGRQEYNLKPFFYMALHDVGTILYRQVIMQDLENETVFACLTAFATSLRAMRKHLAQAEKLYYAYQQKRWFLEAVEMYCDAVNRLVSDLARFDLKSSGLRAFRDYVTDYAVAEYFTTLQAALRQLLTDLGTVKYSLLIKDATIKVRQYDGETDYSADVEAIFEKFKQGAVKDYRVKLLDSVHMNHVEAKILDLVAQLHPDIFSRLDEFCAANTHYFDDTLARFDREVQFYLAYLEHLADFKRAGLKFCYPQVSHTSKAIYAAETFDLALANKLVNGQSTIVCNDFALKGPERILVVSGPNQGGKTTFARTFGQLHFLASLGCPVPGRAAQLYLFDQLYTHFEKEEDIHNLRGKLQDDLVRIYEILAEATSASIIIMNESFTSTTLQDAIFLSKKVMATIIELDALCVCVTFIDELAVLSEKTVSMVSTVVPDNPAERTFKILRRAADGLAYALSVAEKHRLTYDQLKERIAV